MDENSQTSSDNAQVQASETEKKKISIGYFSYIKLIIVLALVILAIYAIYYFMKKFLGIKGEVQDGAAVLINQPLGPGKALQVVYVAGKYLVLGTTNDQVNLLTEIIDPKEIERFEIILNEKKVQEGEGFLDVITDFFKNKLRKNVEKEAFDYEIDSVDFLRNQKERIRKMKEND